MSKITLTDLVNLENQTTAVNAINGNNQTLETAFDNTLSRDGTSPNTMGANLDMNSHHIVNLPTPTSNFDAVRYIDITSIGGGGSITLNPLPVGGTTGQALIKNSNTNFDATWSSTVAVNASSLVGTTLASNVVTSSLTTVGTLIAGATGVGFTVNFNTSTFAGALAVGAGGTGISSYAIGDILYASGATALSKLAAVAIGQPLISGGVTTAPSYTGSWTKFDTANTRLILSKISTVWNASGTTGLHIVGGNSGEARIELTAVNSDAVTVYTRLNGTLASSTPILNNDQIMGIVGAGIDTAGSTTMQQGPSLGVYAYENWNATNHGSGYQFFGIKNTTTSLVNFLTLREQRAGFGTESNPQYALTLSKHATTGIADPFGNDGIGLISADGGAIGVDMQTFGANSPFVTFFRAAGTNAAKVALSLGDIIGQVSAFGYAGAVSLYNGGAGIQMKANQAFSVGNAGTRLEIFTTPDASVTSAVMATFYGSKGLFIGASPADPGANSIASSGSIKSTAATSGVGYATGAGGVVTQGTNRTTGVTLNTVSGAITLFSQVNTAVSGATAQTFTVTNSAVAATDTVIVNQKSGTDSYLTFVTNVSAGSFKITNYTTGGTTNEAPVFTFNIIKGVIS